MSDTLTLVLMCSKMQRRITVDEGAAEHQHQLCRQYQPDEVQVPVTYTLVYDGLRKEGEHQLQDASCQQAHHQLHQGFPVGAHVVQQIPEREFLILDGFRLIELRGDVNQQCDTFLHASLPGADPAVFQFRFFVFQQSVGRVGNVEEGFPSFFLHFV